jgi:hypothetical protein
VGVALLVVAWGTTFTAIEVGLDEAFRAAQAAGSVLVFVGIFLVTRRPASPVSGPTPTGNGPP